MKVAGRSMGRALVGAVLVALLATGCSGQDSRTALGADAELAESSSIEPGLSPSPSASVSPSESESPSDSDSALGVVSESPLPEDSASSSDSALLSNSASPTPTSSRTPRRFIFDLIGLGFDIIGLAFDIADAASAEGTAQATDLTEVYARLDRIETSLEQSRVENQARFSELQNELNRQGMESSIRQFIDIENNGDEAMRAWLVIHQCRINRALGQGRCPDLSGRDRPIEESILRARSTLLDVVDNRWSNLDIPTLAGAYNSRGAGRGLVEGAWNFLRTKQNNSAMVPATSPIRSGEKMPVITPELSSDMNSVIEYYGALIARYVFLRQVAVLEKNPTQNGCEWYEHVAEFFRLNVCQRRIMEQIGVEADRWVGNTDPASGSVLAAAARYKMPIVPNGAIAVVGVGDTTRRIMFFDSASSPPRPKTTYEVRYMEGARLSEQRNGQADFSRMLETLQKYSAASDVIAAHPNAFVFSADKNYVYGRELGWSSAGVCTNTVRYFPASQGVDSSCGQGQQWGSPNWVSRDVREEGTDYPLFGW